MSFKPSIWLSLMLSCVLSACSTTASYQALEPAQAERAASTKRIAIMPIEEDSMGLAEKLEASIASKQINGKAFFTVLARKDIDSLLEEQKLQYSGLVDEASRQQVGVLIGAQALVSGKVNARSASYDYYKVERVVCGEQCHTRYSLCQTMQAKLTASIRMVDTQLGDIIYAQDYSAVEDYDACESWLPSEETAFSTLAADIAQQFTEDISPSMKRYQIVLMDDPDIRYNSTQDDQLEHGLTYLQNGYTDKAERLFSELLTSTEDRSYVAAYNLGVTKEMQQDYSAAMQLYRLADSLTKEPVLEIDAALARLEKRIADQNTLNKQLGTVE
jgi:tetratricopeptide (TPR) repeat protein